MASSSGIMDIGHLIKTNDYDPQLISTFETSPSGVNIEVYDVGNGQNTKAITPSSGCYQIGDTDNWGWSTENLPFTQQHKKYHYYFQMISNNGEKQYGEFLITVPEDGVWSSPD